MQYLRFHERFTNPAATRKSAPPPPGSTKGYEANGNVRTSCNAFCFPLYARRTILGMDDPQLPRQPGQAWEMEILDYH